MRTMLRLLSVPYGSASYDYIITRSSTFLLHMKTHHSISKDIEILLKIFQELFELPKKQRKIYDGPYGYRYG
jgi:hypothetical protein